jgi:hypothetical protein
LLNLKYKLLSFSEKNKNNPNIQEPLRITEEEIIILIDSLDFYIKVMTGNLSAAFLVVDKYRKYDYDFSIYNNLASGFLCNNTFHDISSKKIFRKVRWGYDIYRGLLETNQKLIGTLPGVKIIR